MSAESTKADDIARLLEDEIVAGSIAPGTVLRPVSYTHLTLPTILRV